MSDRIDPDRWHRVSDLFHRALECEPERRIAFVEEACKDDPSLRDEVTSLLAFHEHSDDLSDSATHLVPSDSSTESSVSLVGHTLNQYQVTKKLGEGGMGIVYLADDTRLGRPVALKALAHQFTQDGERRERLRREARAAAVLSHPGIATVYALEEFDDDLYIVTEYVPGDTLRAEVARGPLPLGPVLTTAIEIARALAAAHRHGVIHRDLKPENVIRTPDGTVKILDFGLARVDGSSDVVSRTRLTEPGAILGTPGYISPEQLRGSGVDFRADLFSFGVMVYELASGVHPFTSTSPASTIARVLESAPPGIAQLSPSCPPALDSLVHKCLEKDPERRYASTQELVKALEQLRRDVAPSESGQPSPQVAAVDQVSRGVREDPVWWWQFHQVVVGIVYYLMLIPMWSIRAQTSGSVGALLFFSTVAAVGVAATLRFNLWFTSRFYPNELNAQRGRVFWSMRVADVLFVLLLLAAGGLVADTQPGLAALYVAVAVGSCVAFLFIEPATTQAAFKRRRSRPPGSTRKSATSARKKT